MMSDAANHAAALIAGTSPPQRITSAATISSMRARLKPKQCTKHVVIVGAE